MTTASSADARRDELVERLFGSALGAMDLLCVYVGDRLGLYRALADTRPSTSAELASVTGVNERYAREWLEQQALAGILEAPDPDASDAERRYALPAGHDEVLLDAASLNHMAPMAQLIVACTLPIHAVLEAFGSGDGVPYADYGADLHEGQARFTGRCSTTSSRPIGSPRCRPSTIALSAIRRRVSPTLRAGSAGRASRSPAVTPRSRSTGSTSTWPRLCGRSSSSVEAVWRTVWRSTAGTPRIPSCPAAMTS
jgi:hypothetical protein